jgi:exodeoxyribonuclease VII large subunit
MEGKARLLDPVNVLKRGYSITLHDGKAVLSAASVTPGTVLVTKLQNGSFTSTVNETNNENGR